MWYNGAQMRRRVFVWLLVLAGWTVLAAAFAVGGSLTYLMTYQPARWGHTFATALTEWYAWAVLTPVVAALGRRFALTSPRWAGRAAVLALVGVPLAMVKVVISQMFRSAAGLAGYALAGNLMAHYLIYWGIIAVVHVVAYYAGESQRELRASRAEARLAETRVQLLKTQLHPHFLFNTLNAVSELVHENPAGAERMIAGLSHLLRETLDAGSVDVVPLEREIELLQRYVDIQRVRFGERLDVDIEADAASRTALLPIFILQPLVENAIKHGAAAHTRAGRISVRASRVADRLSIDVTDDGPGLKPSEMRDGVGLGNTRARLQEMYGERHVFSVSSPPDGGTRVHVSVPWQT